MKKLLTLLTILLIIGFLFSVFSFQIVQAGPFSGGLQNTAGNVTSLGRATPQAFAATLVKTLIAFVGIVFMIVLIYGGALYMISQGDPKKVNKAKSLIITALIGLIIVIAAYSIAYFIANVIEQSQQS